MKQIVPSGMKKHCRGQVLLKVLGFSLALTLVFTLVANILPQVEGEAPKDEEVDIGALTMDSFISMGESIFSGKGTCTLCHNNLGRAPDILAVNMVDTADERLQDDRYQGQAKTSEDYLRESMLKPGAYVVKDFGKKGSNDTISPMPVVNKAPLQLSDIEIDAVIAYMQSKDGNDVTVALPTEAPAPAPDTAEQTEATETVAVAASAKTAEEAIGKYFCSACHTILETESPVGPNLNGVGARLTATEIRQSIIDPNAVIAEGFVKGMMPPDFAKQMSITELEMLVEFLANNKE
jgi:mono/diheme cytochrome c family protein